MSSKMKIVWSSEKTSVALEKQSYIISWGALKLTESGADQPQTPPVTHRPQSPPPPRHPPPRPHIKTRVTVNPVKKTTHNPFHLGFSTASTTLGLANAPPLQWQRGLMLLWGGVGG